MTRGDKFRSMTDDQIVDAAFDSEIDDCIDFCQNLPECDNPDGTIPEERCKKCMLEWLQEDLCKGCFGAANNDCQICDKGGRE